MCTEHPEFHSSPIWQGWRFLLSQHWTLTPAACSFFHPQQPHSALSVTFLGSISLKECGDPINSIISRHLGFFIVWGSFVVKWLTLREISMLGYKISAKLGFNLLMFKVMSGAEFQSYCPEIQRSCLGLLWEQTQRKRALLNGLVSREHTKV